MGVEKCESNANEIVELLNNPYIYKDNQRLFRFYSAGKIINDYLRRIDEKKIIVIWGGGIHTAFLFQLLSSQNKKKIKMIVDNELLEDEYGLEIGYELPLTLKKKKADIIIVSAFSSRYEIIDEIIQNDYAANIFDVYDELQKAGFNIDTCFHENVDFSYEEISELLSIEKKHGISEKLIKAMIAEYFHIKDFLGAFRCIDVLIDNKYFGWEYYYELKDAIQNNLDCIAKKNENKEHIIINLIDALRFDEMEDVPFLKRLKNRGLMFENMYTVAPYTSATLKTIFSGKLFLDDNLYNTTTFDFIKDAPLFLMIKERGYDIAYYGVKAQDSALCNKLIKVYFAHGQTTQDVPSTIHQFLALAKMEESPKCIIFIHNLAETHSPYMNGAVGRQKSISEEDVYRIFSEGDDSNEKRKIRVQIADSQKYLSNQLEFYGKLYGSKIKRIYFSDHGQFRGEKPICIEGFSHILFVITGHGINSGVNGNIVSIKSFTNIMRLLINERYDDILEYNDEIALLQTDDLYSKEMLKIYKANNYSYKDIYIQHRGVVTTEDIYLIKITGEEFYFLKDSNINLIENREYQGRIEYLRKIAGNKFIDINKTDKYKITKKFYNAVGLQIKSNVLFFDS